MKCLCIGICQLGAMVEYLRKLKGFSSIYEEIVFYPVFNVTAAKMKNVLDNELPSCDLVISQPVSSSYKDDPIFSSKTLRERCLSLGKKHYIVANCYFTGYDPVPFQTTGSEGDIMNYDNISYFPSQCIDALISKDIILACVKWNSPDLYRPDELSNNYNNSINELKYREKKVFDNDFEIDIKISDFIENNYLDMFLFHTYNHPTNILIKELYMRLLDRLGLPRENCDIGRELLGDCSIPPPPSVYYGMGMRFSYPKFMINSTECSTKKAMEIFCNAICKSEACLHDKWRCSISWGRSKVQTLNEFK